METALFPRWRAWVSGSTGGGLRIMLAVVGLLLWTSAAAQPPSLALTVSSETLRADMPFTLTLQARGFEEEPVPDAPEFVIDGCDVKYLGVNPSVSTSIQIVNGRRSEWREVTYNYRWRITASAPGRYRIPPLSVTQGSAEASAGAAEFEVTAVPRSGDMVVRMQVPTRPVWVGETFDVAIEWLLARDADGPEFSVPLFDLDGAQVVAGEGRNDDQLISFRAGAQELRLPGRRDDVRENGRQHARLTFPARVTLNAVGTIDLAPIRVVAKLKTGMSRDRFGFRRPTYELFSTEGGPLRLAVRPLPLQGRPASFVNAIGDGFTIDVRASRTVVSVGEPIDLVVSLRGAGPLTGLSLPPLGGSDALPEALFSVPEGSLAGAVDADGRSKRFDVTVRVKSAEVREIPPLAFSYFDPGVGEYSTVYSDPIALAVGAGNVVGVDDVVAATVPQPGGAGSSTPQAAVGSVMTLLGAEMAISDADRTLALPWGSRGPEFWLVALYGAPLLLLLAALAWQRTEGQRRHSRGVRAALAAVERILDDGAPAREAAPAAAAAMRKLAAASGLDATSGRAILQMLETRAFDPAAASDPLADNVIEELRALARAWAKGGEPAGGKGLAVPATATILLLGLFMVPTVPAQAEDQLAQARALYQSALAEGDRVRRVRLFEQAALTLQPLAHGNLSAAELQTDWGNAALGAQDRGQAVLGWRRALRADPGNDRAARNLEWLRNGLPIWLPRPASSGALDSLLFWRERFTPMQLHLIAGGAFALAVLAYLGWRSRRWPWCRAASLLALIVWVGAAGTALLVDDQRDAGVVVQDGVTLRAADSAGASPIFPNPLPAGTEVTIVEIRDTWRRIALADGTLGWLPASSVDAVVPG